MFLLLVCMLSTSLRSDPLPGTTDFAQIMKNSFDRIQGVSFLVEGEQISLNQGKPRDNRPSRLFQAHYAFRVSRPPAGILEVYRSIIPNPPSHWSTALLNGTLEMSEIPEPLRIIDPKSKQPQRKRGAPASLNGSYSPHSFFSYGTFPISSNSKATFPITKQLHGLKLTTIYA